MSAGAVPLEQEISFCETWSNVCSGAPRLVSKGIVGLCTLMSASRSAAFAGRLMRAENMIHLKRLLGLGHKTNARWLTSLMWLFITIAGTPAGCQVLVEESLPELLMDMHDTNGFGGDFRVLDNTIWIIGKVAGLSRPLNDALIQRGLLPRVLKIMHEYSYKSPDDPGFGPISRAAAWAVSSFLDRWPKLSFAQTKFLLPVLTHALYAVDPAAHADAATYNVWSVKYIFDSETEDVDYGALLDRKLWQRVLQLCQLPRVLRPALSLVLAVASIRDNSAIVARFFTRDTFAQLNDVLTSGILLRERKHISDFILIFSRLAAHRALFAARVLEADLSLLVPGIAAALARTDVETDPVDWDAAHVVCYHASTLFDHLRADEVAPYLLRCGFLRLLAAGFAPRARLAAPAAELRVRDVMARMARLTGQIVRCGDTDRDDDAIATGEPVGNAYLAAFMEHGGMQSLAWALAHQQSVCARAIVDLHNGTISPILGREQVTLAGGAASAAVPAGGARPPLFQGLSVFPAPRTLAVDAGDTFRAAAETIVTRAPSAATAGAGTSAAGAAADVTGVESVVPSPTSVAETLQAREQAQLQLHMTNSAAAGAARVAVARTSTDPVPVPASSLAPAPSPTSAAEALRARERWQEETIVFFPLPGIGTSAAAGAGADAGAGAGASRVDRTELASAADTPHQIGTPVPASEPGTSCDTPAAGKTR